MWSVSDGTHIPRSSVCNVRCIPDSNPPARLTSGIHLVNYMNNNMDWCVYDNRADDVIAVWRDYETAITFCYENRTEDDLWEVFPWTEVLAPVGA